MTELPAWLVPHMPVIYGLAAGSITKFGLAYEAGGLTRRKVVGQLSMLAVLLLIVEMPSDWFGVAPTARALAGAGAALLGAKLIAKLEIVTDRGTDIQFGLDRDVKS